MTAVDDRISELIASDDVVLFMKGHRGRPQCGFSARVVEILDGLVPSYRTVDALSDPAIREGIKTFSNWPTIPQLYVRGEFIGGCDIVTEMFHSGELFTTLGLAAPERVTPTIHLGDTAAERIRAAATQQPGAVVQLTIDAQFRTQIGFAPLDDAAIIVEANSLELQLDPLSATRADGLRIDIEVDDNGGASLRVDNPNAPPEPPPVQQLPGAALKAKMDAGASFELLDVRRPEERAIAHLAGSRILDEDELARLETLPRDTPLVFTCHHGTRSQQAAEHFRNLGFTEIYNHVGGIAAWSREIDPSMPQY